MWSHWEFGDDGMSSRHVSGSHNLREPDYYYTHESDRKAEFWTPVPICGEAATNTLGTPVPLISCTTQRAFFRLGGKLGYQSTISIRTNSDAWAGCLELHHKAQVTHPGSPEENSPQSGDTCELVVISKGFAYNDNYEYSMDEWKCKERPRSGEKYEFYNVMWISWLDGIAYRNGIGRVPKKIWEKEELESIDLVLG